MSLSVGMRLGTYEILSVIGAVGPSVQPLGCCRSTLCATGRLHEHRPWRPGGEHEHRVVRTLVVARRALLQLVLTGFALEAVRSLIDYGTEIAPRDIALSMIVAACHAVALVASFGRADQMAWRMCVLMGCQVTAAFLLISGLMGDSFAGAGPLPRSEWGSGLVLGMIRLPQGLSLLLSNGDSRHSSGSKS